MAGEIATTYVRIRPQDAAFRADLRRDVTSAARSVSREARVDVHADTTHFRNEVQREAKSTFRQVAALGAGVTGGIIAVDIFRDIGRSIRGLVEASAEEEVRAKLLSRAIDNAGASHRAFGSDIDALIDKESRLSGFTDQELSTSLARLVQATKNTGRGFKDLTLAEDVSRIRKIQLGQAAIALSKAEQGSATALARLGIIVPKVSAAQDELKKKHDAAVASGAIFTKQQDLIYKTSLAQAAAHDKEATRLNILATVEQRFGGARVTYAHTAEGALSRLKVAQNELAESLGVAVLPAVSKEALALADLIKRLQDSGQIQEGVAASGRILGEVLSTAGDVARTLGPPLLEASKAAAALTSSIGVGPIVAAVAGYKALGIGVDLARAAEAKYLRVKAAATGTQAASATARKRDALASTEASAANERLALSTQEVQAELSRGIGLTNAQAVANERLAASSQQLQAVLVRQVALSNAQAGANVRIAASAGAAAATNEASVATSEAALANDALVVSEAEVQAALTRRMVVMNTAIGVNTRYAGSVAAAAAANEAAAVAETAATAARASRVATSVAANEAAAVATAATAARASRLALLGRGALSFVGGPQGAAALGLAAAAAGVVYLVRQQTSWEKSNDDVKRSLGALDASLQNSKKLRRELADVTSQIPTDKLTVQQARLTVEQERANVARSSALPGTRQAREEALRLAQAQDQLRQALNSLSRDEGDASAKQRALADERARTAAKIREGVADAERLRAATLRSNTALLDAVLTSRAGASSAISKALSKPLGGQEPVAAAASIARERQAAATRAAIQYANALERQGSTGARAVGALARALGRLPTRREIVIAIREAATGKTTAEIINDIRVRTARAAAEAGKAGGEAFDAGFRAAADQLKPKVTGKGVEVGDAFGSGVLAGIKGQLRNIPTGLDRLLEGKKHAKAVVDKGAADAAISTTAADKALADAAKKHADAAAKALRAAQSQLNTIQADAREQIDSAAAAVRDAQDQLALTIEQGQQQITDAVQSSKQNLDQIGQSLSEKIGALLDKRGAGPAVDKIPAALRKQFQALRRELAAGAADPKIARDAAALAQSIQRQQTLGAGEPANLDKVKERIRRNIADLTFEFNKGALNEDQFNRRLNKILRGSHVTVKNAGKLLGSAFAGDLQAQIRGLRLQASAEAAGPRRPGSGLEPAIIKPLETVAQVQRETAAAQKELGHAQLSESKEQTRQQKLIHGQLVKVEAAVKASRFFEPQTRPDGAPGRRTKGMTSAGARRP